MFILGPFLFPSRGGWMCALFSEYKIDQTDYTD